MGITLKAKRLFTGLDRYKIRVTNPGADASQNLVVTSKLRKQYVVTRAKSKTASCVVNGRKITCTLSQLDVSAQSSIKIIAAPNSATGKTCATVTASTDDPNTLNNKACAKVPN